ncbi:DUF58 domain-containing protein [Kitasatospora paracochleata]|uniref:Uncharacterized protein (DUF58 family) n=2 Tax=Kitasatospora paracochleata TaxID=58354 RepID=A0ABT1J233_9ACTN|nr:DUF58 domain-containing protein [Kitasatospora paracochleata]MCP2311490.1 uncharacterized protein (DUF58 family) [Kitasatospora paracochleata]
MSLARALGEEAPAAAEPPPPPPAGRRLTARALRLLTVAVTAVTAALLLREPWLLAPAGGAAVLLALGAAGGGRPTRPAATAEVAPRRCFEGDTVTARITVDFAGEASWLDPGVHLGPGVELRSLTVTGNVLHLELAAARWGHPFLGAVDIDLHDRGGLTRRTVRVDLGRAQVFPVPGAAALTPVPVHLPPSIGEHTARRHGEGIEVVGVSPYAWGERQRRIHWPSTTRRGALQLNRFAAEHAADTVVLIDTLADYQDADTGTSSLDESVRAAAGIARAYLRSHDRVGIVTVGTATRWLRPGTGDAHFHRIVESVLDARDPLAGRRKDRHRQPAAPLAAAVPADALVYALTPLADHRILDALGELTARGTPLVVVEVPTGSPRVAADDPAGALALALWQAEREAMRAALRSKGIPVVAHHSGESLDLSLAPLLRSRIPGRSR